MSPENRDSDGQRLRRPAVMPDKHKFRPHKADRKKQKKKKEKKSKKLELNELEANKSLYLCHIEYQPQSRVCYVVRSIKLSYLFSSDSGSDSVSYVAQVGYKDGDELPDSVGCGVLGSQIVFAAGRKPCLRFNPTVTGCTWYRDIYVFETDPNKQQQQQQPSLIRKMDAQLLQAKYVPLMMELCGKLYALSYNLVSDPPSFEVFDPKMRSWSALPEPPFLHRSLVNRPLSYAISGTKMFVSENNDSVYCFDVSHPHREWRLVDSMCFPFTNEALVLDLPGDNNNNKKIMFTYSRRDRWRLGVYIIMLDENRESIKLIANLKLPMLPEEFDFACSYYVLHIGGQKACLVAPKLCRWEEGPRDKGVGTHKTRGVVIPFQFEVDTIKIDKDPKNCLALQFMPTRIFEFHTNPSSFAEPDAAGCFVL